jgi:hypothetical protein
VNSKQGARIRFAGILFAGSVALIGVGAGCGDDDPVKPPDELAPPTDLVAVNGNNQIVLTWDASPDEETKAAHVAQYNVYRHTSSIIGVDPAQLEGYQVATVESGTWTYNYTVANGTLYYFHVRAEDEDGKLSNPTNEEAAAGRAEGTGVVIEEFASTGDSGFDFSTGGTVSLSQDNPNRFELTDIYLGTSDTQDDISGELTLKSPELLARLNTEWAAKQARIKILGNDWDVSTGTTEGLATSFGVLPNAVYMVRTPGGSYGKIQITSTAGDPGERTITFRWSYQPTPGLIEF